VDQRTYFDKVVASKDMSGYYLLQNGEFAYNKSYSKGYPVGSIKRLDKYTKGALSTLYICFALKSEAAISSDYLVQYFNSSAWHEVVNEICAEGARNHGLLNVSPDDFFATVHYFAPTKEEQEKVATFLSLYDKKIYAQMAKVEALEKRRKGLLQQVFSQEIRFRKDDGTDYPDWDTKELNTYLFENKERNKDNLFGRQDVLSVSKDYGVINQIEYQGKSLAGENVSNYHVVHSGNIIYTKSPLGKQPYGIIKASQTEGIVSTLYAVYYCKENVIPEIIDCYFSLDDTLNRYLKPLVNIGAKHDMKINNTDALSGTVTLPSSIDEQKKIVQFFTLIDKQIQTEKKKLEAMKLIKKSLLQQMFV
jgi:type I restriction enzyme S subunit